ncbi:hypothetical protein [Alicyclobacillus vulcanalis]|uniref:Uncharacterized protein n=1 Tax=Alicyclobacillus vulcanalis TaxID=252246 RepID=A0A1N7MJ83_9BACL|nr:hypothetical protein [Alicyclobacillus vulcanalis]SIS86205.1 hypothetical protein SAMN05421799_105199 [Alicyclobacillus vulcanalis]
MKRAGAAVTGLALAACAAIATGCGHPNPPDRWTVHNKWLYSVVTAPGQASILQVTISNPHKEQRLSIQGATLTSNAFHPVTKAQVQASQSTTSAQYTLLWNAGVAGPYQGDPVQLRVQLATGSQSFALGKAYTRVVAHPVSWLDIPAGPNSVAGQPDLLNEPHDIYFQLKNPSDTPVRLTGLETAGGFQFSRLAYRLNDTSLPSGYPSDAKPLGNQGVLIPPHATCNVYAEFKQPSGYLNELIQVAAVLEKDGVRGEELVGPAFYTVNYFVDDDPSAYYPALNVTS